MQTVTVGVRLSMKEAEALARLAAKLGRTKSDLLRPAVREYVAELRGLLIDEGQS